MNALKLVTVIVLICVPASAFSGTPDIYEDDNSFDKAGIIGVTSITAQHHNFHIAGDQDWMKFYALAGENYEFIVNNITDCTDDRDCYVSIELYKEDDVTPIENALASGNTNSGSAFLSWTFSDADAGICFIKVRSVNNGSNTAYDITVSKQLGPLTGSIRGKVTADGSPIGGVILRTSKKITAISSSKDGYYGMESHPSGDFTLTAEASGYETYTASITLKESESLEHDICLSSIGIQKGDINGDNSVDLKDAIQALKILSGLLGTYCKQADVNGDNKVGLEEVIYILQKVAVLR